MKHTDKAIKQELEYIEQANNYAVLYCVEKRKYTKRKEFTCPKEAADFLSEQGSGSFAALSPYGHVWMISRNTLEHVGRS